HGRSGLPVVRRERRARGAAELAAAGSGRQGQRDHRRQAGADLQRQGYAGARQWLSRHPHHEAARMIKFRVLTLLAAVFLFAAAPARADLKIDINRGSVQPMPIAVSPFYGAQAQEGQIGKDVTSVISANLERSGLFRPLDPKAFIQTPEALKNQPPRFPDWRAINAQALVHGDVEVQPDGRLKIQFRLWDVYGEAQMEGRVYTTALQNWRRVAHIISDAIYKRITDEDGYFDTQIVYISESG